MGNVSELLQKSKMGTMLEVYETLCDEGVDDDLAVDMINRELYANPGDYNNPEDMYKATHKQFGYEARLNQVINSIREMIRGDVVQVVQTGHKEQILALREDLLSYVDTIDSFEEDV